MHVLHYEHSKMAGKFIQRLYKVLGFVSDAYVQKSIIGMYSKCGEHGGHSECV
jgi:hypothetical protein